MKNKALAISSAVIILISIVLIFISVRGGNPFVNTEKSVENLNQQLVSVDENIKVKEGDIEDLDREISKIDSVLSGEVIELSSIDSVLEKLKASIVNPVDVNYNGNIYKNYRGKNNNPVKIKSIVFADDISNFGKSSLAAAETFKCIFVENEINSKAFQLNKKLLGSIAVLEYGKNSDIGMIKNLIATKYYIDSEFDPELLKEVDEDSKNIKNKIMFLAKVENRFFNKDYPDKLIAAVGATDDSKSDDFNLYLEKLNNLSLMYYDTLAKSAGDIENFELVEKTYEKEGTVTLRALSDSNEHIYLMEETSQGGDRSIIYYDEASNPWFYVNLKDNNVMDLNLTPSKVVNQKAKELLDKFATIATPSTEGLPSTEEIPSTEETSEDTQSSSTDSDNN